MDKQDENALLKLIFTPVAYIYISACAGAGLGICVVIFRWITGI